MGEHPFGAIRPLQPLSSLSLSSVEGQMAAQATLSANSAAGLFLPGRRIGARGIYRLLNQSSSSSAFAAAALALRISPSPESSGARIPRRASCVCHVAERAEEPSPPGPASAAWCVAVAVFGCLLLCGPVRAAATAASDSIRASGIGLKVAAGLRRLGWPDEAVVFALATLPVIELRGAIPVGYWMQLPPLKLTILSILGNMVPVPLIVLYLESLTSLLAKRSAAAGRLVERVLDKAKKKAAPVEEFQWLGLMLFVAVPFPGTGAWTGAMIAAVLGMEFWAAVSANFLGVVFAGLLVNLLVNLGLKLAIATGVLLFFASTFMWAVLRRLRRSKTRKEEDPEEK